MPKNTLQAAGEAMPTIASLFAQWQHQMDLAKTAPEDKADARINIAATIEARMNELQPVTAADFAMKLLVVTGNGDFEATPKLIEEAKVLASDSAPHQPQQPLCAEDLRSRLIDIEDKLKALRSLNEAVFMAAFAVGTSSQRDAIQTVAGIADERIDSIIEDVAEMECNIGKAAKAGGSINA
jgi:phosphomevalonate kinase